MNSQRQLYRPLARGLFWLWPTNLLALFPVVFIVLSLIAGCLWLINPQSAFCFLLIVLGLTGLLNGLLRGGGAFNSALRSPYGHWLLAGPFTGRRAPPFYSPLRDWRDLLLLAAIAALSWAICNKIQGIRQLNFVWLLPLVALGIGEAIGGLLLLWGSNFVLAHLLVLPALCLTKNPLNLALIYLPIILINQWGARSMLSAMGCRELALNENRLDENLGGHWRLLTPSPDLSATPLPVRLVITALIGWWAYCLVPNEDLHEVSLKMRTICVAATGFISLIWALLLGKQLAPNPVHLFMFDARYCWRGLRVFIGPALLALIAGLLWTIAPALAVIPYPNSALAALSLMLLITVIWDWNIVLSRWRITGVQMLQRVSAKASLRKRLEQAESPLGAIKEIANTQLEEAPEPRGPIRQPRQELMKITSLRARYEIRTWFDWLAVVLILALIGLMASLWLKTLLTTPGKDPFFVVAFWGFWVALPPYYALRLRRLHPLNNHPYRQWLLTTPWRPGLPLPLGPINLQWRDALLALLHGAAAIMVRTINHGRFEPKFLWLLPVPALVFWAVRLLQTINLVLRCGLLRYWLALHALAAAILLAPLHWKPLPLLLIPLWCELVLARTLHLHPWDRLLLQAPEDQLNNQAETPVPYQRVPLPVLFAKFFRNRMNFSQVGYHARLSAQYPEPKISRAWGLSTLSLLAGWFVLCVCQIDWSKATDNQKTGVLVGGWLLVLILSFLTLLLRLYGPLFRHGHEPLSIWGRIFTGRLIIWRHERIIFQVGLILLLEMLLFLLLAWLHTVEWVFHPAWVGLALIVFPLLLYYGITDPRRHWFTGAHRIRLKPPPGQK